jgi:manganese transport protein
MNLTEIKTWFKTMASFVGPGYMVSIGYFDPGNWATDLAAGSKYGYRLLFVIFIANLMAMLLQSICIRLGVVTGHDLASGCTKYFPRWFAMILYVLCEVAIMATDLAGIFNLTLEVIGSAIALNLLFGIPMAIGVILTAADVLVILLFWGKNNLRYFEFFIICLVLTTAGCLFAVTAKSSPVFGDVMLGYLPSFGIITEPGSIFISVGIIGATVMPHNLYLHSSITQYRAAFQTRALGEINELDTDSKSDTQPLRRRDLLPTTIQLSTIDSVVALAFALLINSSILIISASNFYTIGKTDVAEIQDAFYLIKDLLGKGFAVLFATGLLLAGQASTITGTLTGQIIMEGFLGERFRVEPWVRRVVTRLLAVVPALVCIFAYGERSLGDLLIYSQVILSLQLPFAIWPLIYFTSSKKIMTVRYKADQYDSIQDDSFFQPEGTTTLGEFGEECGESQSTECFANSLTVTILACIVGALVTVFNVILLIEVARGNT